MTRQTQGLVLAFVGAVLLRLALSDAYLRYVTEWMKWPILASGVLLLALAVGPLLKDPAVLDDATGHPHDGGQPHGVPASAWLLLLPGLVAFTISPPELGSYLAERRANESAAPAPAVVADLDTDGPNSIPIGEFKWRAVDGDGSLVGREVTLTGFVTHQGDAWFITRMSISCCAADAMVFRARVEGAPAPPRDQWVKVTGRYVAGTGETPAADPVIEAFDVAPTKKPRQPYE